MHTVKVGDRFRTGGLEWCVNDANYPRARFKAYQSNGDGTIILEQGDVDLVEWIEPEVTFTKEQVEAIEEQLGYPPGMAGWNETADHLRKWLDERTEP